MGEDVKQPIRFTRDDPRFRPPDWTRACVVCGWKPVVPITGMCGPCTFGVEETAAGEW
jgi:hypothetical protein